MEGTWSGVGEVEVRVSRVFAGQVGGFGWEVRDGQCGLTGFK